MHRVTMVTRRLTRPAWATRQRVLAALALLGYGAFVVKVLLSLHGVPASRDLLVPIMLGGFLAVSITSVRRMRRLAVGLLLDWTPFVLSLWLYDLIRGMADGAWLGAQFAPQIRFDEIVGGGTTPTVWLQQHLWHGASSVRWYDYATWVVYMSYFFGTTAVLAVLWWRSRALFRRFAANVVVLAFVGCVTFVLYPADPPWLAAQEGTSARCSGSSHRSAATCPSSASTRSGRRAPGTRTTSPRCRRCTRRTRC